MSKATLKRTFQAEYENAIDCLYYGYGYNSWLKYQREYGSDISDEDAKRIWKLAFDYMCKE